MPDEAGKPDAVSVAGTLAEAMQALTIEVGHLRRSQRRSWQFITIDVVLTVALAVVSFISVRATQSAEQANAAQAALCQAGNVSRSQQLGVWDYLLSLTTAPSSAAPEKLITEFRHHLDAVFAPRNCTEIGKGR